VKSTTDQPEQQEMDKIIAEYDHLFQGIGKITDKKNNREIYGHSGGTGPNTMPPSKLFCREQTTVNHIKQNQV
jgi:hypothetical protein